MDQALDILGDSKPKVDFTNDELKNFILCYMDTGEPLVAAIRAGLQRAEESVIITAARLMNHPAVKAGISALQQIQAAPAIKVTRDSLVEDCQAVKERALIDRQYNSTLGAIKLQAQLKGILEEKVRVVHDYNPMKMTDEELEKIASGEQKVIDATFQDVTPKAE